MRKAIGEFLWLFFMNLIQNLVLLIFLLWSGQYDQTWIIALGV